MNMKTLLVIVAVMVGCGMSGFAAEVLKKARLKHVVAVKFKEGTTQEQIKTVKDAFKALKKQIKEVDSLEWGTNVSPEKHDKGFTHCFILSFKSNKDRDAYLVHPDHKAFGQILGPVLADVFVVDFWPDK